MAGAAALLLTSQASAECIDAPELAAYESATAASPDSVAGPTRNDRLGRVVAPVMVNGQGPFRFIVDTGANRSALSEGLAQRLGLQPSGMGDVHSIYGVTSAPLIHVASLRYRDMMLGGNTMPVLGAAVLSGEHGLLGVDGMTGRRLRMDFQRHCIEIVPSRNARRLSGWTTLRGELRFGHLVLIEGRIAGLPVRMFVDTGSNTSLANIALRDRLRERTRLRRVDIDPVRAYTAGDPVILDSAMALPLVNLGPIEARDVLAYVGDFYIFRLWGLTDEPAMLIGMDLLSQTRAVAIDYERATVQIRLREQTHTGSRIPGFRGPGVTIRE